MVTTSPCQPADEWMLSFLQMSQRLYNSWTPNKTYCNNPKELWTALCYQAEILAQKK